jgi:hypothetical protein
VPGPLVFPRAAIASLAVEPVSSPSLPSASVGAPSLALSAHTVPSPLPPPRSTTDWVVDSGASFHTTPTTTSLPHSHPPHPSHPTSIVVGNGSTLPVTSVGTSALPGQFCLNDVLVAPGLTHPSSRFIASLVTTSALWSSTPGASPYTTFPHMLCSLAVIAPAPSILFTCPPLPTPE